MPSPTGNIGFDKAALAAELARQESVLGEPQTTINYLDAIISAGQTYDIKTLNAIQERFRIANIAVPVDTVKIAQLKAIIAVWKTEMPGIEGYIVQQYPDPTAGMLVDPFWFLDQSGY